jgi:hypothetical protein
MFALAVSMASLSMFSLGSNISRIPKNAVPALPF